MNAHVNPRGGTASVIQGRRLVHGRSGLGVAASVPLPRWVWLGSLAMLSLSTLLGSAYASLPLWLPTEWLRNRLCRDIGAALGSPVDLNEVRFTWRDGLVLRALRVSDPNREDDPLLEIREVRCVLDPLHLLIGKNIDRLEINHPRLNVRIDDEGRVNLGRLQFSGDGPSPRAWHVREMAVEIVDVRQQTRADIRLANIDVALDPETGRTTLCIEGRLIQSLSQERLDFSAQRVPASHGGRFETRAALTVPTVASGVTFGTTQEGISLGGVGRVQWDDIDLSSLPIHLVPGIGSVDLAGRFSGVIEATVADDLEQTWFLDTAVRGLRFSGSMNSEVLHVSEASIRASGRWRPAEDVVELTGLRFEMPGLEVEGQAVDDWMNDPLRARSSLGRVHPQQFGPDDLNGGDKPRRSSTSRRVHPGGLEIGGDKPHRSLAGGMAAALSGHARPVMVWDLAGDVPLRFALRGQVDDLRRALEWLPVSLQTELFRDGRDETISGGLAVAIFWAGGRGHTQWSVELASERLALGEGWPVRLEPGSRASVSLDCVTDSSDGMVRVRDWACVLPDFQARGSAVIPRFPREVRAKDEHSGRSFNPQATGQHYPDSAPTLAMWLQDIWRRGHVEYSVEMIDAGSCLERVEAFRQLTKNIEISGPFRAAGHLNAKGHSTTVRFEAEGPAGFRCRAGDWFEKEPDQVFLASVEADYPHEPDGWFRNLAFRLRYGEGEIASIRAGDEVERESSLRVSVRRDDEMDSAEVNSVFAESPTRYTIDASLVLGMRLTGIDILSSLSPRVAGLLHRHLSRDAGGADLKGDVTLDLAANLRHVVAGDEMWPALWRVSVSLDAERLEIAVSSPVGSEPLSAASAAEDSSAKDWFSKQIGERASGTIDYWFDRTRPLDTHRVAAELILDGGRLGLSASFGGGSEEVEVRSEIDDLARVTACLPWLADAVERYSADGGLRGSIGYRQTPAVTSGSIDVDLTDLDFRDTTLQSAERFSEGWHKPRDIRCRFQADARTARPFGANAGFEPSGLFSNPGLSGKSSLPSTDEELLRWEIGGISAELANCRLWSSGGHVMVDAGFARELLSSFSSGGWSVLFSPSGLFDLDVSGQTVIVVDSSLRSISPALAALADRLDLNGQIEGDFVIRSEANRYHLGGSVEAAGLKVGVPEVLTKVEGMPASLRWDIEIFQASPSKNDDEPEYILHAREVSVAIAGVSLIAHGEAQAAIEQAALQKSGMFDAIRWKQWNGLGAIVCDDLAAPAEIYDPICIHDDLILKSAGGRLLADLSVHWESGGKITLQSPRVRLTDARFLIGSERTEETIEVHLDGALRFAPGVIESDGLTIRAPATDLTLGGSIDYATVSPVGTIIVSAKEFDSPGLRRHIERLLPDVPTETEGLSFETMTRWLAARDLNIVTHARQARIENPDGGLPFDVDELRLDVRSGDERVRAAFGCAVNGGLLTGTLDVFPAEHEPYFDLSYEARGLLPTDNTRPIVEQFFPGMAVNGRITLIDRSHQRIFTPPDEEHHPTGSGEMIVEGGTIIGRAAPLWVTRIFPQLNLAQFDFTEMINRFEKLEDGRQNNRMTFYGTNYHLYVDGYTRADGEARYEVGVDLFARISPDLSRVGQGRVPLFIKTGVIRNGVMEDEVVRYLSPFEVTRHLFTNNIVTVTYYTLKKQVLGEM